MIKQSKKQKLKEISELKAYLQSDYAEKLHPFQKGVLKRAIEKLEMEIEND